MRSVLSRVFRYGVATVRCDKDVAADLRGAIASPKVKHFAAITKPADVGALLRAIDGYMRLCNRIDADRADQVLAGRSEEHTSELQSLMRNSYAVFCLKKKNKKHTH